MVTGALTSFNITLLLGLEFGPVDALGLGVLLGNLSQISLLGRVVCFPESQFLRSIVFPCLHSPLNTLIVEVRIILLLKRRQNLLQFLHLSLQHISLSNHTHQRIPQLINPRLRQSSKNRNLAPLPLTTHDPTPLPPLHLLILLLQLLRLRLLRLNLHLQPPNTDLHARPQRLRLLDKLNPLLQRRPLGLQPRLIRFPPLLANLLTPILALHAADARPLITAVAAALIIAYSVIDIHVRHIARDVTFVLAVVAW